MAQPDTSHCPVGRRCAACGQRPAGLTVDVVDYPNVGAVCLTRCRACAADGALPGYLPPGRLHDHVLLHRIHTVAAARQLDG